MLLKSRRMIVALVVALCLIGTLALTACKKEKETYSYKPLAVSVRYLRNVEGETITLSSGREATGENLLYYTHEAKTGDKLTPPEDPKRDGYTFVAWTTDKEGTSPFDFSKPITGSVNLYAQWARVEGSVAGDNYTEPRLSFSEKIVESTPFSWTAVCNQPIEESEVNLTTAGIKRLKDNAANVKELLTYTRASSTVIQEAIYQEGTNKVSVTYKAGSADPVTVEVTVNDTTRKLTSDYDNKTESDYFSGFENKAEASEKKTFGSYGVVLAGSSSMENWKTSTEDMYPVTTLNVAIGGTKSYHWLDSYADRLIIPYNPRAVVFYLGINDIIGDKTANPLIYYSDQLMYEHGERTANKLIELFEYLHERLPETEIYFILINHVPGYYDTYRTAIDAANDIVEEFADEAGSDYMTIIDAGTVLEKNASEDYNEGYFTSDGLHMSTAGYVLWGGEVRKAFIAKEKEIYYHG